MKTSLISSLSGAIRVLVAAMLFLSGTAIVLMAFHVTLDVSFRLFFNSPIRGTLEIVSFYYMVSAVILPIAYLQIKNQHITVDLFYDWYPKPLKAASYVVSSSLTAAFFAIFAYQSWLDAVRAFNSREVVMGAAAIQIWPSRFILPISFAIMTLVTIFNLVVALSRGSVPPVESAADERLGGEK